MNETKERTLRWVAHYYGWHGCRRVQSTIEGGVYDIIPRFDQNRPRKPFTGYEVRFVRMRCDDLEVEDNPDYAYEADIRIVKADVQSEAEARAIAQADFSTARGDR
jgi:hypothetical protein